MCPVLDALEEKPHQPKICFKEQIDLEELIQRRVNSRKYQWKNNVLVPPSCKRRKPNSEYCRSTISTRLGNKIPMKLNRTLSHSLPTLKKK